MEQKSMDINEVNRQNGSNLALIEKIDVQIAKYHALREATYGFGRYPINL